MRKFYVIIILVITAAMVAGCTSTASGGQDTSSGNLRAHFEYKESWWITQGCYGKVTGYVYNSGSGPLDNVMLNFNLVNTRSSTIRDSRSIFFGTVDGGQSRTFETTLDGECTEDYRVDAVFNK